MHLLWKKFQDLSAEELHAIMVLRQRVFIVEQNCPYLDSDAFDLCAWHLCYWEDANGIKTLSAYLRVLPPATRFAEYSIGRIVTAPEARKRGLGLSIMREAIKKIHRDFGATSVRISAQAYLERFYGGLGFRKVGESYLEDGIPHYEMLLEIS